MFFIPLLIGLIAFCLPAHADTTWVAPGTISGNWNVSGSPYIIQGNDTVAAGGTLDIGPGVKVYFAGTHRIVVNGLLRALGTETDSIVFTTDTLANPNRWRGLHFITADTACILEYSVIEHGKAVGTGDERYGGGIECRGSRLTISHSRIRNCYAQIDGGGIYALNNSSPVLTDCEIYDNRTVNGGGAGMMVRLSNPALTNCVIRNNHSSFNGGGFHFTFTSHPVLTNCEIRDNTALIGGGVYSYGGTTVANLMQCTIAGNTATISGGGVATTVSVAHLSRCTISGNTAANGGGVCDSTLGTTLVNCLLTGNTATVSGGGVFSGDSAMTLIEHCTLHGNSAVQGGHAYFSESAATLENCVLGSAAGGGGAHITQSPNLSLRNCDFFSNAGGELLGDVPPGFGVVDTVNLNGTPCDRLENLFLDPQYVSVPGGDFHLTGASPCISAARASTDHEDYDGNPRPNPAGTQPDIGAYESPLGGLLYACGALSGTIGPGDVLVPCDISVETGDTLVIAPGTRFLFIGRNSFTVHGLLRAVGTETDSITFTREGGIDWKGVRFIQCHDSTVLSYVNIEHVSGEGSVSPDGNGGIYLSHASPRLGHAMIRDNHSTYRGGGVACYDSSAPRFTQCVIRQNRSEGEFFIYGGGVFSDRSAPIFEACTIDSNFATHRGGGVYLDSSSIVLEYCLIQGNSSADGGGLYAQTAAPGLSNCTIEGNSATGSGGGLFLHSYAIVNDSWIRFNQAGADGGGVYCDFYDPALNFCVLNGNTAQNRGGGYYAQTSAPVLKRCTMVANGAPLGGQFFSFSTTAYLNSTILANTGTAAMYFQASNGVVVRYCDFSANPSGHFAFFNNDPAQGPANIGILNRENVNGDSADTYFNIFLNPQFVDAPNGDFHILNTSPCVQAGDPQLMHDPDGTIADIGRFYAGVEPQPPLPFDLLSPVNGDTVSTALPQFCWQAARDPDAGDTVQYTLHFVTADTSVQWAMGEDTCNVIPAPEMPFADSVDVVWWVEAHSLFPDTTQHSISTWTFFWAPPIEGVNDNAAQLPRTFALHDNYPNPFNASTVIGFDLPVNSRVKLEVYDVLGRVAAVLADEVRPAGTYQMNFDASRLGSGIYFARLTAGEFVAMRKMVVIK